MYNYVKLLRPQNLLIIALVQYLLRYFIIKPYANILDMELQFSDLSFFLLVLSTILIVASGYIINDYFDTSADRINRKNHVIVGRLIRRQSVLLYHTILNIIALSVATYVSYSIGHWKFVLIFFLTTGVLWYYSSTYKHYVILGLLIISLLTALIPMVVLVYEIPPLTIRYGTILIENQLSFKPIIIIVIAIAIFGFFATFIRELIKDLISYDGDKMNFSRNLPIKYGVRNTKIFIVLVTILFLVFLVYCIYFAYQLFYNNITTIYLLLLVIAPLLVSIFMLVLNNKIKYYKISLVILNLVILFGICFSVLYKILIG